MQKKYLKWSLILALSLFALAVAGVVIYIAMPSIIGFLTGQSGSEVCQPDYGIMAGGNGGANVRGAMSELCNSAKSFIGVSVMLLIVAAGFSTLLSVVIATIDLFQSGGTIGHKILWLIFLWLIAGALAAAAYYFIEVRKRPE